MRRSLSFSALLLVAQLCHAQTGWTTLNIPPSGRYDDVFFVNDTLGWAAGGGAGWIRKTVNGGETWTLQFTSPYYLRSIEFLSADTGFSGSLSGALYRTTNGGLDWTDISPAIDPSPEGICGLSCPAAGVVYGCGLWAAPAYVIKSTDGGETWDYIDMSAYASKLVDIHFTSVDTGFATGTANPGSNGGIILYTTDGGATWTPKHMTNTVTDIIWKIQRLDTQYWFASIYSEPLNDDTRMLRSEDGGMTWTQILVDDEYTYIEAVGFMTPLHGWTGGEGTLWETTDGGATWENIDVGASYNRFFKVNDSTAFLTGQRIYKYQEEISTGMPLAETPITAHRLSVAPNPTDGRITVQVTLDNNTIADLTVLSANGASVDVLMHRKALKGDYSFTSFLKPGTEGTFFIVLKTNEGMLYEKVILTR